LQKDVGDSVAPPSQKSRVCNGFGDAMTGRPTDGSKRQVTVFEGQWEVRVDRQFVPLKVEESPVGMTKGGRKPSASLSGLLRREGSTLFDVTRKVQGSSVLPKTNERQSEDSTCSELGSDGINEEHDSPRVLTSSATLVTDRLGRIILDVDSFSEAEVPKGLVFEGSFALEEVKEYSPAGLLAQRPGGSAPALDQALVQPLPMELTPRQFPTPFYHGPTLGGFPLTVPVFELGILGGRDGLARYHPRHFTQAWLASAHFPDQNFSFE